MSDSEQDWYKSVKSSILVVGGQSNWKIIFQRYIGQFELKIIWWQHQGQHERCLEQTQVYQSQRWSSKAWKSIKFAQDFKSEQCCYFYGDDLRKDQMLGLDRWAKYQG